MVMVVTQIVLERHTHDKPVHESNNLCPQLLNIVLYQAALCSY